LSDTDYNSKIERVASLIINDKVSPEEQDYTKLQKYFDFVKTNYDLEGEKAEELINEALLYIKLKNADDIDPLQEGDKFGAGFS
jgi:hypothetical protein